VTLRPMHRQVLILAAAQALGQIASIVVVMVGGLAGAQLAEDARWATLPVATMPPVMTNEIARGRKRSSAISLAAKR